MMTESKSVGATSVQLLLDRLETREEERACFEWMYKQKGEEWEKLILGRSGNATLK